MSSSLEPLPKTQASARGALAAPALGGLSVFRVPCLSDNYAWVLVDDATGTVAVVDPAEAAPVRAFVEARLGGRLDLILNTHHHGDHVGGNEELADRFGATVVGAACDAGRIPRIGVRVSEGERVAVGASEAVVLETPGHTSGHITFWFEKGKALFPVSVPPLFLSVSSPFSRFSASFFAFSFVVYFLSRGVRAGCSSKRRKRKKNSTTKPCFFFNTNNKKKKKKTQGDTLFALGCGRLFEGDGPQMWSSLSKLLPLDDETRVYCAHEYTQSNARWATSLDGANNAELRRRAAEIDADRKGGFATVPSLLGDEKRTNPFLRPFDPEIRKELGVPVDASDAEAFTAIRKHKDKF